MKHLLRHFSFLSFAFLSAIYLFGCSAQTQNLTKVVQTESAKPSQTLLPLPNNSKLNTDTVKEIDLKINGVGIGTLESNVLQKLGKPLQSKKGEFDGCGGGFQKTLRYTGLEIELLSNDKGRDFSVITVDVTSSEWSVAPGLGVGVDAKDVEAKFGQPYEKEERDGQVIFFYGIKGYDGWANLFFRDSKLTQISWILTYC